MERAMIGNVEVLALSDMRGSFVAADTYPDAGEKLAAYRSMLDAEGKMALNFACVLLRADGRTVLVDAGNGPGANGQLLEELKAAGVGPNEIDVVVFTHLHGDHTGWAYDSEAGRPRFTNARYLVPRVDWEYFRSQEPRSGSFNRDMAPFDGHSALELIEGEHTITPSLVTLPAPGHTPGHTALVVSSQGERAYVIGDAFISPIDVAEPEWATTWDWNADILRESRRMLGARIEQDRALVASSHLPNDGLGRFVVADGQRRWQGIEISGGA